MTTLAPPPVGSVLRPGRSLAALAMADARRFARHPLFLFSAGLVLVITGIGITNHEVANVGVEGTVLPAFMFGVVGFVVAHRLTTALRRSGDLADTAPVSSQRRTLALCLACLAPTAGGMAVVILVVVFGAIWPPSLPGGHVAWFGYESNLTIWSILFGDVVLAALGGPLLGVALARWAPFRGSALLGMCLLVIGVVSVSTLPAPWYAASPWVVFNDETLRNGEYQTSFVRAAVSPVWWSGYAACLCGLAVVAALLRDPAHRRGLVAMGGLLVTLAAGFLLLSVG